MNRLNELKKEIKSHYDAKRAAASRRYFKTGKGQYGEGDVFYGLSMPEQRKIAKHYSDLSLTDLQKLLNSDIHEHRMIALLVLIIQFQTLSAHKEDIVEFYLSNTHSINNWDLVDVSAHKILGAYLLDKDRDVLYKLAKSNSLWERRIAMIATFAFINNDDYKDAIALATKLLRDDHDLIHKAVGWVMREVGKHDEKKLTDFLDQHSHQMPRTMLRYAIEKFPEEKRQYYLKK